MPKKIKVIVVVGPTASGKTALGIGLAKAFGGEVISADSMQIYKNMPIASAAVTDEEADGVKHHLVGFAEPTYKFSVAEFVKLADQKIAEVVSRDKTPIVVGGTGLYIDSLINGIDFNEEDSAKVREKFEKLADEIGMEALFERLKDIDPIVAARLHQNDRKRIIRALEKYELHGKTSTELDEISRQNGSKYEPVWIGITYKDREMLYERINHRVDVMLEMGLLDEAKQAFECQEGKTSVQAIGHKEFFPYFNGEITLEQSVDRLKTETRRYAKRQLTWFRRNENINWIYADEQNDVLLSAKEFVKF